MFGEENNLTDTNLTPFPLLKGEGELVSYTKTNKLITALYMVTDIIDKDEPLRGKLRVLGVAILSDIISTSRINLHKKIQEVLSFLDLASAINIISEMNCSILKKEFLELVKSLDESREPKKVEPAWLEEFLFNPPLLDEGGVRGGNSEITTSPFGHSSSVRRRGNTKRHTRIGVQKGSTLMQALSDRTLGLSDTRIVSKRNSTDSDILKKQRREQIITIIKTNGGNATIKDIKIKVSGTLVSCSEKTLQRELVSMAKDGVLKRTGEKRWSRYSLV